MLDRSIGILNTVAQLMGVLVGLLALILTVVAVFGFFEYRRWRAIRKSAEKAATEIKKIAEEAKKSALSAKESAAEAKPIVDRLREALEKAEKEAETIRKSIGAFPPLGEPLPEELKKKLEELGKKVEFLENFGVQPKFEDYFARAFKFHEEGKYELALEAWNKAIELKPDDAEAWGNRACAYARMDDKENALKNLSRAIELDAELKEKAKQDKDFQNLWGDEDFKKLTD